ncbi:MAG: ADP-ribosylglycohydrolase family protein [Spirochaetes bacterium]|nr:MAG: ADP-ribosylglycohydrolase family protein [Spirochaetota bacterium]RKX88187.1 MAG: ADP-ribosylglycohydrolase family protein [Spirochaetota bacterium]
MRAWEYEFNKYHNASPVNFKENPSDWSGIADVLKARQVHLKMFWSSQVPGSRAPESLYMAMIQSWYNRGFDVSEAEKLIRPALASLKEGRLNELERLSGQILKRLMQAPVDKTHPSHQFFRPEGWEDIRAAFREGAETELPMRRESDSKTLEQKILGGWNGQIAGGSYGTAIEGYTGETLRRVYGDRLNGYIKEPETLNDDITFELAVLKAAERSGAAMSAEYIADMWLEYIPFGWSAEYFALENLRRGYYPPASGQIGNFFSEWIGAQMRTMVCGYLAPGNPLKASEYAYMDSSVSHEANGIYGGIHSAVLSSLAFVMNDARELLLKSRDFIPEDTEFAHFFDSALESVRNHNNHIDSWKSLEDSIKTYNWIHVYPNMMAVIHGFWYCENDIGKAFRILADCGADVDCNAGEVGSALGIMFPIDRKWTDPFEDTLETYVPGMEKMKISELAGWTADIVMKMEH